MKSNDNKRQPASFLWAHVLRAPNNESATALNAALVLSSSETSVLSLAPPRKQPGTSDDSGHLSTHA